MVFERFSGFPRVIGAVDGCHIPIRTPSQYPQSYLNRLRSHSIILQVINYASVNSTSAHLSPREFDTRGWSWQMKKKKRILYSTNAERTSFIMLRFVNLNEL